MSSDEDDGYPIKVGDLVRYTWASNASVFGIVVDVVDPPNSFAKIDYTLEILGVDGRRFSYDIFVNGDEPEVISRGNR